MKIKNGGVSKIIIGAVLIVVLVIGAVVGIAYVKSGTSPPTATGSTSLTTQSNILSITVSQAITDTVEQQCSQNSCQPVTGQTDWLLTVHVTDVSLNDQAVQPGLFVLTSSSNANYWAFSGNAVASLQNIFNYVRLAQGQVASGQLAFELPNGETPAKLSYSSTNPTLSVIGTTTNIPAANSTVSHVEVGGPLNGGIIITGTNSSHLNAVAINGTDYFYSDETVAVTIQLVDSCAGSGNYCSGSTVTVSSIVDDNESSGPTTIGLSRNPPITVATSTIDVILYLKAPPTPFNGMLTITLTTSGSTGN